MEKMLGAWSHVSEWVKKLGRSLLDIVSDGMPVLEVGLVELWGITSGNSFYCSFFG